MASPAHHASLLHRLSTVIQERNSARRRSSASSISSMNSPTISRPFRTVISTPPRRLSASPTDYDLRHRAVAAVTALYSNGDSHLAFISPEVVVERDGHEPMTSHVAFRDVWSRKLAAAPDFQLEVSEAVVDEVQRKVWVRGEVSGLPDGKRRESYDMLEFDEAGVLVATSGYWRTLKDKEDVEVEE